MRGFARRGIFPSVEAEIRAHGRVQTDLVSSATVVGRHRTLGGAKRDLRPMVAVADSIARQAVSHSHGRLGQPVCQAEFAGILRNSDECGPLQGRVITEAYRNY